MRILIVSEVFHPENFIINDLAREWVNLGHTVEVLTQYPSYPQSYVFEGYVNKGYTIEEWDGIKIHRFPIVEGYKEGVVKKTQELSALCKRRQKDCKKDRQRFRLHFCIADRATIGSPARDCNKKEVRHSRCHMDIRYLARCGIFIRHTQELHHQLFPWQVHKVHLQEVRHYIYIIKAFCRDHQPVCRPGVHIHTKLAETHQ